VKSGWTTKRLGECIVPREQPRRIQRAQFLSAGVFPVISQEAEFTNGFWNESADVLKVDTAVIVFGDHTRVLKYVDFDFVVGADGVKVLQPREFLVPKFLYYQLILAELPSKGYARHFRYLRELDIHFPAWTEQRRIVALLDAAFEGIATAAANAERNLQNARDLFESHLAEVFSRRGEGWVERRLEEVCGITSSLVDPRELRYRDLTHVGAANIESVTGGFVELKTAKEEQLISGKFVFDSSMVLYSKIRPYLRKVARPGFGGLCSADMYPLAPKPSLLERDFLFYLLLSRRFTEYAIQGSARAGMPKVNREHLFAFRSWIPPVETQAVLAASLDSVALVSQQLAQTYDQKQAALAALKRSLLHQAFNGEL
jgi:type I restriction enzyme S subunit